MYSYFVLLCFLFAIVLVVVVLLCLADDNWSTNGEKFCCTAFAALLLIAVFLFLSGIFYHRTLAEVGYIRLSYYGGTTTLSFKSALSVKESMIHMENEKNPPMKEMIENAFKTTDLSDIGGIYLPLSCIRNIGELQRKLNGYPSKFDGSTIQCNVYSLMDDVHNYIDHSFYSESMINSIKVYPMREGAESIGEYEKIK